MNKRFEIFNENDGTGKVSSKRVAGLVSIAVALIMALIDQLSGYKLNVTVWTTMFGGGLAILGVSMIPSLKNNNNQNPL